VEAVASLSLLREVQTEGEGTLVWLRLVLEEGAGKDGWSLDLVPAIQVRLPCPLFGALACCCRC
jgi:hypothetical protein